MKALLDHSLALFALWRTVSATSKVNLAEALASGSADAVVDVLSEMGATGGPLNSHKFGTLLVPC